MYTLDKMDVVGDLKITIDTYSLADTWSLSLQEGLSVGIQLLKSLL